jgi:iron(III) transport system substrate-binding protein
MRGDRTGKWICVAGAAAGNGLLALLLWIGAMLPMAGPARAQEANPSLYAGPDRAARILAGAKKEGTLTLYASMAEKDLRRLVSEFERRTGIKVNVWRAGKDKVLQRVVAEARAGRFVVDFIHNPSPEMEALHREGLLQEVRSPVHRNVIPAAIPAHREWVGGRIYIFVLAYNTTKVKAEELPRTYRDLLDPRWKGRLGIEAKEAEWFYTLVKEMGEESGMKFFRDLVAINGLSVRDGNALLNNLVVAGEVPLAITMYSYLAEQSKRAGAPLNWFTLQPTIAYTDGMAVAKRAPHPYAAMLFYDFVFSEGETLLTEMNHVTTNRRNEAMLAGFQPKYIDVGAVLDGYDRWEKIYQDTIQGRGAASK